MKSEDLSKTIIPPETSLKSAMRSLSASPTSSRTLFVVDESERLIGSVSDGDIRRSILNGAGFSDPVSGVMFKSPRFVRHTDKDAEQKIKKFILNEKLYAIPILDETDRILDILFWFDFFESHPLEPAVESYVTNPVVIMAGGKGTRLDPFTKILPKPLIPFGDKPIIEKIMDNFKRYGFNNFLLTLNYKKEIIKMYLKENRFPYNIDWVEEESYLGTAGSLSLLKGRLKETFIVCNCDVFLDNDFKNILLWHKAEKALVTLIGCHKEMIVPYGILEVKDGQLRAIKEKPVYDMILNTGVYVMEPEVLKYITDDKHLDMTDLLAKVMEDNKVSVYPVCGGWFDLGEWKEYKDSLFHLQNKDGNMPS